jgi:hypothetical protein
MNFRNLRPIWPASHMEQVACQPSDRMRKLLFVKRDHCEVVDIVKCPHSDQNAIFGQILAKNVRRRRWRTTVIDAHQFLKTDGKVTRRPSSSSWSKCSAILAFAF